MLLRTVQLEQLLELVFKAPPLRRRNAEELPHQREEAMFRLIPAVRRLEDNGALGGTVAGHRRNFGHNESFLEKVLVGPQHVGGPKRLEEAPGQVPGRRDDRDMRDAPLGAELEVALALIARAHALEIQHIVPAQVGFHRRLVVADGLPDWRRSFERR